MKNASCHDDKMEAYCNAVRALEDKFYAIELNHVPRRYNEEADELAKIASGQITVPPNVFLRGMSPSRPLTSTRIPRARRNPRGLPRVQQVRSLWTRTPRMRRMYSPCSMGMAPTRPKPWIRSRSQRGGLARQVHYLDGSRGAPLGSIRGQTHRQDGQVIHPRRRRAVQVRRVGRPTAMRTHPSGA
jgi:hypothetical protein